MHHGLEVRSSNGYAGVFATRAHPEGRILLPIAGQIQSHPTRYSIQITPETHLEPVLDDVTFSPGETQWRFINHSCDPNTRMDVEARVVVALRPIEKGEELTFNYNTTEWDMAVPFRCHCGSPDCTGQIQGFRHLTPEQQEALLPLATPHLRLAAKQFQGA